MGNQPAFLGLLSVTAVFIPFASANVIASVYDVTPSEVRSSALAVQTSIESAGAAMAPWLAGLMADQTTLRLAILAICAIFFVAAAYTVPGDIEALREKLRRRARRARRRATVAD